MKNIALALVNAQTLMSNPKKDASNPFFKSKYADLNSVREAVIPILNEAGISVLQPIVHIDGKNFVKTMLLHVSGESIEGYTEIVYSKQNDAQAQGSGITYARRYGLQSIVCVGADDDDGNAASVPQKSAPAKQIEKKVLEKDSIEWHAVTKALTDKKVTLEYVKSKFILSTDIEGALKLIAQ